MNASIMTLLASTCALLPNLNVSNSDAGSVVTLRGPAAKAIYEHLTHALIQVQHRWLAEKRTAYGVECTRRYRWRQDQYSCVETLNDGKTVALFKFVPAVKDESKLLFLKLGGTGAEQLFASMSSETNPEKLPNGSTEYKKISSHLTCTETVDAQQSSTFVCDQVLSPAGYAWGTGTAPIIGAGTIPVSVDVQ